MSHFSTVETLLRDPEAIRAAAKELGYEVLDNAEVRGYGGKKTTANLVVRLKGTYDLGLQGKADGSYAIVCDWWQGHVASELGEGACKLLQRYGVCKTRLEARKHGYNVSEQQQQDGSILMRLRRF